MISVGGYVRHIFILALVLIAGRRLEVCQARSHPTSPTSNSTFDARNSLSFQARVRHQRALEEVYWKHRTWFDSKRGPKPERPPVRLDGDVERFMDNDRLEQWYSERHGQLLGFTEQVLAALRAEVDSPIVALFRC